METKHQKTDTFTNLTGAKSFTGARSDTAFLAPQDECHQGCVLGTQPERLGRWDGMSLGPGACRPALGPALSVPV